MECDKVKKWILYKKAKINLFNKYIKEKVKDDPLYPVHKKTKIWMKKFIKNNKRVFLENFEN